MATRMLDDEGAIRFVTEVPEYELRDGVVYRTSGGHTDVMSRETYRRFLARAIEFGAEMDASETAPILFPTPGR